MRTKKIELNENEKKILESIIYFGSNITHAGSYFITDDGLRFEIKENIYIAVLDTFLDLLKKTGKEVPEDIFLILKTIYGLSLDNLGEELESVVGYSKDEIRSLYDGKFN